MKTGTTAGVQEWLDCLVAIEPVAGHDGRSGARIERGVLDTGRRVVIKWSDPRTDLTACIDLEAEGRELRLWESGVLNRLPAGVSHAILAAGRVGHEIVTVMRDFSPHVLSWQDRLTLPELRRLFAAVASMHQAFRGRGSRQTSALPAQMRC